jgi:hypothetical protein
VPLDFVEKFSSCGENSRLPVKVNHRASTKSRSPLATRGSACCPQSKAGRSCSSSFRSIARSSRMLTEPLGYTQLTVGASRKACGRWHKDPLHCNKLRTPDDGVTRKACVVSLRSAQEGDRERDRRVQNGRLGRAVWRPRIREVRRGIPRYVRQSQCNRIVARDQPRLRGQK